ncbi:hypothetical protein ABZ694_32190 [Streptomyces albidoflavus]|uniref:hypothetical protein n=1 Tax=Streptomyces albidoflavus TaxID=1886 RepID=UPI0033FE4C9E
MPATAATVAHAYQARTTDYDGAVSERPLTAAEADDLIAWAIVEKDKVVPDPDRSGRLTITRTITGWTTATGTDRRTLRRVVRLEPTVRPRRLTERQYQDLDLVAGQEDSSSPARRAEGRVHAGFGSIPPAAAARLFTAGWLIEDPDGTVLVSFAGRVAMVLHQHRTETGHMGTHKEITRADGVRLWTSGISLYLARCSCGHRDDHRYEEQAAAQAASRAHRAEHLRALFA